MLVIVMLSLLRFAIPSERPEWKDLDYAETYIKAVGQTENFWEELQENYTFNFNYLISWILMFGAFIVTIIVQICWYNPRDWFEYEKIEKEYSKRNKRYMRSLMVITMLWTLMLCVLFVIATWQVVKYWLPFTKTVFCTIGIIFIFLVIHVVSSDSE